MTDQREVRDANEECIAEREISLLRAALNNNGLVPKLPAEADPTPADIERVYAQIIASEPASEPAIAVTSAETMVTEPVQTHRTHRGLFALAASVALLGGAIAITTVGRDADSTGQVVAETYVEEDAMPMSDEREAVTPAAEAPQEASENGAVVELDARSQADESIAVPVESINDWPDSLRLAVDPRGLASGALWANTPGPGPVTYQVGLPDGVEPPSDAIAGVGWARADEPGLLAVVAWGSSTCPLVAHGFAGPANDDEVAAREVANPTSDDRWNVPLFVLLPEPGAQARCTRNLAPTTSYTYLPAEMDNGQPVTIWIANRGPIEVQPRTANQPTGPFTWLID